MDERKRADALPPIETEEMRVGAPPREYIPLPGGWEIQTKGGGSTYRLCDTKTGERHMILSADIPVIHDFVTRMAKEIREAYEADVQAERDRSAKLLDDLRTLQQGGTIR